MASNYQIISDVSRRAAADVTRSPIHWMRYLDTASRMYKYSFHEQLLIHAQRPDATACASFDFWNDNMGRWVNRGAKGIALIDDTTDRPRLKYVFDVSDTHPHENSREVYLWNLRAEDRQTVTEHLKSEYGIEDAASLADCLYEGARSAVRENLSDYLETFSYSVEGSFLEEMDDLNLEVRFRELMTNSLHYTLMRRCGLDAEQFFDDDDFRNIYEFNTPMSLAQLGCAVSETAEPILTEIGRAVRTADLQREENKTNNLQNHLANSANEVYNNFSELARESKEKGDVSDDEDELHEQGGLSDTGYSDGRTAEGAARTLREDAEGVSERASQRTVSGTFDEREAVGASYTDRQDGGGTDGELDAEPDESGERGRGAESQRPDGVARTDEQHTGESGRNRDERTNLQLNSMPDSDELSGILSESDIPLAVVDETIRMGGNERDSVLRIAAHFMLDAGEDADFLKGEYGSGAKGLTEYGEKICRLV